MTLNELAEKIHENAVEKGFWQDSNLWVGDSFAAKLALIHSELSEALEAHRAGEPNLYYMLDGQRVWPAAEGQWRSGYPLSNDRVEGTAKPEGIGVELADALIRILDLSAAMELDLDGIVAKKMAFNASRPWKHGKGY